MLSHVSHGHGQLSGLDDLLLRDEQCRSDV
ncbi:hypothetical protein MFUL124B02_10625 [Myxococcus fulvus 124B02]|nr:hypothetical protein MFUL124B02_10625 [Myxococcus fulvus 124B02]